MNIIFLILLLVLSINIQAQNYKRYEFPPLENTDEIDHSNTTYNNSTNNNGANNNGSNENRRRNNQKEQSSYFQQPRYIYPKSDNSRKNVDNSSGYNYPSEEQPKKANRQYKFPEKKSKEDTFYRGTEQSTVKNKNYKSYSNRSSNYSNNDYSQSNPNTKNYQQKPYSNYKSNQMNGFGNPYNSYPYSMNNPFSNNGFTGNNGWNPMSNGSSMWPNINNGMMGRNPTPNYPNIRTPGFFSR